MLCVFFFLEKKEPKIQEKTIPAAQATRHRVFSRPARDFIMDLFVLLIILAFLRYYMVYSG